ncbi:hypothetical protein GGF46_002524 [Coemansia sp. RSA 552]|nr:hypothetical protein GGF46_002524 [Coemansia sp. RSA 552]
MSASPKTTPPPAAPEAASPEFKAFVGNLPFQTTEEELKEFFAKISDVAEARVIKRGKRPLGYGFVTFASDAAMNKAIEAAAAGLEMEGRAITVEAARPPTAPAAAAESPREQPGQEPRAAKPRRTRTRNRAAVRAAESAEGAAAEDGAASEAGPEAAAGERKPRQRRFPRRKAEAKPEGPPSETVAFVGNLPYATTDDELSKLFAGFSISSAHVVTNKFNNRSRGYGFVTFGSPADQAQAIAKYTAEILTVNERPLQIVAAVSETPTAPAAESAESASASATPAAAATPAQATTPPAPTPAPTA